MVESAQADSDLLFAKMRDRQAGTAQNLEYIVTIVSFTGIMVLSLGRHNVMSIGATLLALHGVINCVVGNSRGHIEVEKLTIHYMLAYV